MEDLRFLKEVERPDYEGARDPVRLVDLFCGCGGLTLGLAEAARRLGRGIEVALAVDSDPAIAAVYAASFPKARVEACGVEEIFDGRLGDSPTAVEAEWRSRVGLIDMVQGGPPCQGHSGLNNHTRGIDHRNRLYERMARAAEVLEPRVVLIENVPSVRRDAERVVQRTTKRLADAGYRVAESLLSFVHIGVPQRRRRHVVLALREFELDPKLVLESLRCAESRDVRWAIGDLADAVASPLDVSSRLSSANQARIDWLFDNQANNLANVQRPPCHHGDHSYISMYGRLRWDQPAQTITSGYGSMGQGRYVHPSRRRTLTPHEAARLQFFPDWFDFTAGERETRRGVWATMIGNAVPPKLTMELGKHLLPALGYSGSPIAIDADTFPAG